MAGIPLRPVTVIAMSNGLQQHGERLATHALVLKDDLERQFQLPVGPCEALGIKVVLDNRLVARPITHDLIVNVIGRIGAELENVIIERVGKSLRARITLRVSTGTYTVDASHGDAVALALRSNAEILATEQVITGDDEG